MPTPPDEQELERRLQALQQPRFEAVRKLARTRQVAVDKRAEAEAAEREDTEAYAAAIRAGWTADELKSVGYDAPGGKPAGRPRNRGKRPARAPAAPAASDPAANGATNGGVDFDTPLAPHQAAGLMAGEIEREAAAEAQ